MTKYLAGVLTVIAGGVLAVAYGLLAPGNTMNSVGLQPAAASYQAPGQGLQPTAFAQPVAQQFPAYAPAVGGAMVQSGMPAYTPVPVSGAYVAQPGQMVTWVPASAPTYVQEPMAPAPRRVRAVAYEEPAPRVRTVSRRTVERQPRRDWKRTALIVGGSTAAGAGIGGIVGGKKGALIGAAIAGGATTIFQTTKRD